MEHPELYGPDHAHPQGLALAIRDDARAALKGPEE